MTNLQAEFLVGVFTTLATLIIAGGSFGIGYWMGRQSWRPL